jgi:hypothetical protein
MAFIAVCMANAELNFFTEDGRAAWSWRINRWYCILFHSAYDTAEMEPVDEDSVYPVDYGIYNHECTKCGRKWQEFL